MLTHWALCGHTSCFASASMSVFLAIPIPKESSRVKIDRMFRIVYLLMGRERVTAKELADDLEVSVRTVHRDIESLMQAGVPVYTSRGVDGGISLVDGFVLDKTVLSEAERERILVGLQSLPGKTASDDDALQKLSALFGKPRLDWIEVDFSRWGYKKKDDDRFGTLRSAILLEREIRFGYAGATGGLSERHAYPLKLVFKSKAWYMQAYCLTRDDYRTFKVNRMIRIVMGEESFDRSRFTVPELEAEGPRSNELIMIELAFSLDAASRVYDEFDVDSIEVAEEGIHVYTEYPDEQYLYDLLASFGNAVEVIAPQSVRDRLDRMRR